MIPDTMSASQSQRRSGGSSVTEGRLTSGKRMGILSRTIGTGSQIRWILPARIRSKRHRDVVFIGGGCLQLREYLPDGLLAETIAKLNIGSEILVAKIISAESETIATVDQILEQEWDEEEFLLRGAPCPDDQPPQIIVLCTALSELVYVYATTSAADDVKFVYAKQSMVRIPSMLSCWGRHMAVDRQSKLLVVSSLNSAIVYSLKEIDDIKAAIDSWSTGRLSSFHPDKQRRFLTIDGQIIRMDFLRSNVSEQDKIFLLMLVAKHGDLKFVLYRWDSNTPLTYLEPVVEVPYVAPRKDSFPLLLIPALNPMAFFINNETELVLYEDIRLKRFKRTSSLLYDSAEHVTVESPTWVTWVKPSRHDEYHMKKEEIILVRQDGLTRCFSKVYDSNGIVTSAPGPLNIDIDTAVCILPGPRNRGGDTIIAVGDGTDGGVFWLGPRRKPEQFQVISNIGPVHSLLSLDNKRFGVEWNGELQDRTFALTATRSSSKVLELRSGFEALCLAKIALEGYAAIDRIWAIEYEGFDALCFIASDMMNTIAVMQYLSREEDTVLLDDDNEQGIIVKESTLAAARLDSGVVVQITPSTIQALSSRSNGLSRTAHNTHAIVNADIDTNSGTFVVVHSTGSAESIAIGKVGDAEVNPSISISPTTLEIERPFSVRMISVGRMHLLALGYFDGSLQLYVIHPEGQIAPHGAIPGSGVKGAAISSIDLWYHPKANKCMILTGTLNGCLNISTCSVYASTAQDIQFVASHRLGKTKIAIKHDDQRQVSTVGSFVSGDLRLCYIALNTDGQHMDYTINDIWVTDRVQPSYCQPPIHAVCRVPVLDAHRDSGWSTAVLLSTPQDLLCVKLLPTRRTLPRTVIECTDSRHFQFSPLFQKLVVVSNGVMQTESQPAKKPAILLIDVDDPETGTRPPDPVYFGESTDQVKCLLNWSPSDGLTHYNLLVIAVSNGRDCRVGHISAKKLRESSDQTVVLKTVLMLPNTEIYAICELESSSLVISAGNQLILLHLELTAKKWTNLDRYSLPSPAKAIFAKGPYVYAATIKHSMIVLKVEGQKFVTMFSGKSAQPARIVVPFGTEGRSILLSTLTKEGTSIYGYMQGVNFDTFTSPSFEVQMPVHIDHVISSGGSSSSSRNGRSAFYGSTIDGNVYAFKTLRADEWRLLRFLEKLVQQGMFKPSQKGFPVLTKKMTRNWKENMEKEGISTFDSKKMHVHGDTIEQIIDKGSAGLRKLLGMPPKDEDDEMMIDADDNGHQTQFEKLATLVVGQSADPVVAVVAWARKLLRSSRI